MSYGNPLASFCPVCGSLLGFHETEAEARAYEKTREGHSKAYCLRVKTGAVKTAEPEVVKTKTKKASAPKKRAAKRKR